MKRSHIRFALYVTTVVITFAVMLSTVAGQSFAPGSARAAAAPRTPWGAPDLQGTWTSEPEFGVPFERPAEYGNRELLNDEEYARRLAQSQRQAADALDEIDVFTVDTSNAGAVGSPTSPPPHWLERSTVSRRTSLVIDPPDGKIPATTPQARGRLAKQVRGSFGNGPFNGPTDFTLYDRCITRGVPNAMFPAVYNATTRIVQGPDSVAITYEMIHETRVIALDPFDASADSGSSRAKSRDDKLRVDGDRSRTVDSRAPVSGAVREYLGVPRGWWDGNTLVVETTNFNGKTLYRGASDTLRMVERFTRVDEDTLRYDVTLEDADTWARPWTAQLNLKPRPEGMFEYACHEGNYGMRHMLSAARAAEKR